jgi:predicted benzoate:H+ symporter BenE
LGVPVDVLTPNALPDDFRHAVISQALPIWVVTLRSHNGHGIAIKTR